MPVCPRCHSSFDSAVRICPNDGTVLPLEPAPDANIGQLLEGKYRIDAFISAGGMGAVYRATHVMLDKTVAIKLIRRELVKTAEASTRFQREARAASTLEHPNIAAVFDFGQTADGTLYIAMDYVEGPSLKDIIRNGGPMEPAKIVAILGPVASALARAHRHHIVHRDLKPHNILLDVDKDGRQTPKLLDFGIAKTVDESEEALTLTGFALGTPQYMSPEQTTGQAVDGRSDLYSLGVVLYEMLIGEVPFADTSVAGVLLKQMTVAPDPPSRRRPDVHISPALEAIALRCLEKEPDRRFQSAEEFIAALAQTDAIGVSAADAPTERMSESTVVSTLLTTDWAHETMPSPLPSPAPGHLSGVPPTRSDSALTADHPPVEPMAAPPGASTPSAWGEAPVRVVKPGTQPTVVVPAPGPQLASTPSRPGASPGPSFWLAAAVVVLAVLGSGAWVIRTWAPPFTPTSESTPAPVATPAMAQPAPSVETAREKPSPEAASRIESQELKTSLPPDAIARAPGETTVVTPPVSAGVKPGRQPTTTPAPSTSLSRPGSVPAGGSSSTPSSADAARATPPAGGALARAVPDTGPASETAHQRTDSAVAAARVENPSVFVQCNGPSEICSPVRSAMADALGKNHMQMTSAPARADVTLAVDVELVEQRVQQSFGTTFAPRTYSVDVAGESHGLVVSMPPARTFSFDAQVGRERANENARLIASDVVEKVRDFWNKRP